MRRRREGWVFITGMAAVAVILQTGVMGLPGYGAEPSPWERHGCFSRINADAQGTPGDAGREEQKPGTPSVPEKEETTVFGPSDISGIMFGAAQRLLDISSTGDLWDQWQGDMDFPGLGTRERPYEISSLSHLMGLSQAVTDGLDFRGKYFQMTQDIDMGNLDINGGSWNPIGWYQDEEDIGEPVTRGFSGTFDGCGNTISGLRICREGTLADYAGLFGLIDGGCVKNLRIEDAEIYGGDKAGILAGTITGDSEIFEVQVSGYVRARGDAGGLTGAADGKAGRVLIENCSARGVSVLSEGGSSYTGGLAGQIVNSDLVDNVVMTQDGNGDRIQGKGYTGGITGRMKQSGIYNSYVDGTIGGSGGKAVGGMVGLYESGDLMVARFAGDIGRTNNGAASREGTFIGMRRGPFTYGTDKGSNLSYLFTNTSGKAKKVFGSSQDGDNTFTRSAHVGYWTSSGIRYVTVAGMTEIGSGDRYFYEELEEGVRFFTALKLDGSSPARPDHFAPGYQGEPVKGYLLSVPRIDAANANGTYDTDVAVLTAIPAGTSSYYRTIDKDHSGAVAPGATVSVATAARNTETGRYQMAADASQPSGVRPPTYMNEEGEKVPMTYVSGGGYSFPMPSCDTQIHAEYVKVTTEIGMDPAETVISVTQTRLGDRKHPRTVTEVRDQGGVLIARYINGSLDTATEVQPVRIHGEHNVAGSTADRTIKWSVDDSDLLTLTSPSGYTAEDARIMPDLNSSFIRGILNREEGKQADSGYGQAISPVVYRQEAVVTGASNPDTSADNQAVYGNCKVTVTLQILDHTTRRVEGLNLNHGQMICTVTRTLKGDRKNPEETITCSVSPILAAELYPEQPFYKNVSWKDRESGQILTLHPSGNNQENCAVDVRFDPVGKANPAWIQNVIRADNEIKGKDPYRKLEGSAVRYETITATSEDQTHGIISAECGVTIRFVTDDQTEILPEQLLAEAGQAEYELTVTKTGSSRSPVLEYRGFEPGTLKAKVLPECPEGEEYRPYDRSIAWTSGDAEVLAVSEEGIAEPQKESSWIRQLLDKAFASGTRTAEETRTVEVRAAAGGGLEVPVEIKLHATARDMTSRSGGSGGGSGSNSGRGPGGSGGNSGAGGPGVGAGSSGAGGPGVGAGNGGAGGPGVGSGSGVTDGLTEEKGFTGNGPEVPLSGTPLLTAEPGQWIRTEDGYWIFQTDGQPCRDQWVYIENPYADPALGQSLFDWFRFDPDGHMVTGWFQDQDGYRYYLNPVSDRTLGRMMTGWVWIPGEDGQLRCYYFQEHSDGWRGALYKNRMTPDGFMVNDEGAWIVENEVQIR